MSSRAQIQLQTPSVQVKLSNSPPFSWTRQERATSGGKAGASRGGTWQSRSGETRDGAAAWTPILRTAPGISSGGIPPAGERTRFMR